MNNEELFALIENNKTDNIIYFPEELYNIIDVEQAVNIKNHFTGYHFFKLPKSELDFFEWLKQNDLAVWEDIWADDLSPLYCVSIDLLPYLIEHKAGFPICDLIDNDNYYFNVAVFINKETALLVETIKLRFLNKDKLTIAQTLLLEMSLAPIDIWHFAYKYKLSLDSAKKAVEQLVDDNLIFHYKTADEISLIIEV